MLILYFVNIKSETDRFSGGDRGKVTSGHMTIEMMQ